MKNQELFLKTMFCCMACDGDIAQEEIEMVRKAVEDTSMFDGLDVEAALDSYIAAINQNGKQFLWMYLSELSEETLTTEEELLIVEYAIKMIEADNRIEYSEVKFFKKIRSRLLVSDEQILERHPDKEDFLLPDIDVMEEPFWDDNVTFANIQLCCPAHS